MSDVQFIENFRATRASFQILVEKLHMLQKEDTAFRKAISLEKQIAIALYALGSSAEYRSIANLFGVGRTTVGEIVLDFCDAVWRVLKPKQFTFFESLTSENLEECIKGFKKLGFPQCYGAIDGIHIEVVVPKEEACDYYNFKGWHSTVLLAVVDYRYRFTYINVGAPGRVRDCYLYDISPLKKLQENSPIFREHCKVMGNCSVPAFLIGDSAFALTKNMMKPYPFSSGLSEKQIVFNTKLSKSRRVVENAFGHLKARFRKIGRWLEIRVEKTSKVIKSACVLHNFLNNLNDDINQHWLTEAIESEAARSRQQPN